jgi:hypothetical protein
MSIKLKIVSIVVLCMVASTLGILLVLNHFQEKNIQSVGADAVQVSRRILDEMEKSTTDSLKMALDAFMTDEAMKDLFAKGDRDVLYDAGKDLYQRLNKRYGITNFNFITDEGKVFLRLQRKDEFGDQLVRIPFKRAVETQSFGTGKEIGKCAFALRAVHPYVRNGQRLGYVEIGKDVNVFYRDLKTQTGNEVVLIMKKKYVKKDEWDAMVRIQGIRDSWDDLREEVVVANTLTGDARVDFHIDLESIPEQGTYLKEIALGDRRFTVGLLPVHDAAGNKVGGVYVFSDVTALWASMNQTNRWVVGAIVAEGVLLCLAMLLLLIGVVRRRLDRMMANITRILGGDVELQVEKTKDELSEFETQLKNLFVQEMGHR